MKCWQEGEWLQVSSMAGGVRGGAPTLDTSLEFQVATYTSDQPPQSQGFHDSLLRFDNLLKWLTKLKKTITTAALL